MAYLQENWMWIVAGITAIVGLSLPQVSGRVRRKTAVATTLSMNRENAAVLDVRPHNEFKAGHIKGAKNIPLDQLESRLGDLESWRKKSALIISCDSEKMSRTAYSRLSKKGFNNLYLLQGGLTEWKQTLPLTKS